MGLSQDERVGDIIHRIQVFVFPRRIRTREFFHDFDHLRIGRCTRKQVYRAFCTMNFNGLSESEADLLADYFTDRGGKVLEPQVVNYYKLCDLIDACYVEESNPDPLISASSPGTTMLCSFRPASFEEEETVMHIIHRVASLCKARGVHFKECFSDHANLSTPNPSRQNPFKGGKCTVPQFIRSFPFTKDFGEADVFLLIERYKTKTGDIHFQALHNDISEVMHTDPPPFPTSTLVMRADHTDWAHNAMDPAEKIKCKVIEKRIRLYEHFQDFDPLRKGYCTVGQVKTVFTLLNIAKEINKNDFEKLVFAFLREDGLFCYADFCAEVDSGFTRPGLEKEPQAVVNLPDATSTSAARRNHQRTHDERRRQAQLIEEKIRTRTRLRRILLKPFFKDMDRAKRGFITRNQFSRAMGNLGFTLSEVEIGLIASIYCNYGNHLDFNYLDFVAAVDPNDEDIEVAMQQAFSPMQNDGPSRYFDTLGRISPSVGVA
eukprot:TRINITY_DN17013_c0_g1_i1.p1 TRINITY_DN17013_c0_g1~~TRINITY_DN17013_c0_g1_i1.p1  ORF type:complete len:489 (+),score=133.56 TRINITY_DN17013_c0_g1_i1:80-1546(+)